jgi:hypothetical protein
MMRTWATKVDLDELARRLVRIAGRLPTVDGNSAPTVIECHGLARSGRCCVSRGFLSRVS